MEAARNGQKHGCALNALFKVPAQRRQEIIDRPNWDPQAYGDFVEEVLWKPRTPLAQLHAKPPAILIELFQETVVAPQHFKFRVLDGRLYSFSTCAGQGHDIGPAGRSADQRRKTLGQQPGVTSDAGLGMEGTALGEQLPR